MLTAPPVPAFVDVAPAARVSDMDRVETLPSDTEFVAAIFTEPPLPEAAAAPAVERVCERVRMSPVVTEPPEVIETFPPFPTVPVAPVLDCESD